MREEEREEFSMNVCPPHLSLSLCLSASLYLCPSVFLISPRQTFAPLPASALLSDSAVDKPSAHHDVIVGSGSGERLKWSDVSFGRNKHAVNCPKQTNHLWGRRKGNLSCLCRYWRRDVFSVSVSLFVWCSTKSCHTFSCLILFFLSSFLCSFSGSQSIVQGLHMCLCRHL